MELAFLFLISIFFNIIIGDKYEYLTSEQRNYKILKLGTLNESEFLNVKCE